MCCFYSRLQERMATLTLSTHCKLQFSITYLRSEFTLMLSTGTFNTLAKTGRPGPSVWNMEEITVLTLKFVSIFLFKANSNVKECRL